MTRNFHLVILNFSLFLLVILLNKTVTELNDLLVQTLALSLSEGEDKLNKADT